MRVVYRILPGAALLLAATVALAAEPIQPTAEKFPRSNSDRTYTLNPSAGSVRFGDGAHGGRPPSGSAKTTSEYRRGGGKAGQVPDAARKGAPSRLRHRNRAVSGRDFKELAGPRPAAPGRARVAPQRNAESADSVKLPAVQKRTRHRVSPKLNPQPEPPSRPAKLPAIQKRAAPGSGDDVQLRPQPEPPGRSSNKLPAVQSPADKVGINPQPEPPGKQGTQLPAVQSPADKVGINPQPEPPGKQGTQLPAVQKPGEDKGFNPQPEPPAQGGFVPQPYSSPLTSYSFCQLPTANCQLPTANCQLVLTHGRPSILYALG
ncbi:MAG: hypothetical protein P8009_03620 [Gammaproteobacteria bacterium]